MNRNSTHLPAINGTFPTDTCHLCPWLQIQTQFQSSVLSPRILHPAGGSIMVAPLPQPPLISICYVACAPCCVLECVFLSPLNFPRFHPVIFHPPTHQAKQPQGNLTTRMIYTLLFLNFMPPQPFCAALFYFRLRCGSGKRKQEEGDCKVVCGVNFSIGSYYIKIGNLYY